MPIPGHVPELFDAEAPFTPRGTPAQAWSLACMEEGRIRLKTRTDLKLTQVLARRWLDREDRQRRGLPADGRRKRAHAEGG
jgi:hypothetical protein